MIASAAESHESHPVMLAWFYIQILVNSKLFKLSCHLFLMHLRAQIVCFELKGDLSPVMLKDIFYDSFKKFNFKVTRICMENHSSVTVWKKVVFLILMPLTFGGHCNRYF